MVCLRPSQCRLFHQTVQGMPKLTLQQDAPRVAQQNDIADTNNIGVKDEISQRLVPERGLTGESAIDHRWLVLS